MSSDRSFDTDIVVWTVSLFEVELIVARENSFCRGKTGEGTVHCWVLIPCTTGGWEDGRMGGWEDGKGSRAGGEDGGDGDGDVVGRGDDWQWTSGYVRVGLSGTQSADQRTSGPADQRTSGPADQRTSGPA